MEKEKILLYPYSRKFIPLVEILLENDAPYEITSLVAPKAFIKAGCDAADVDKRPDLHRPVTNDFQEALKKCDTVVIADCEQIYRMEQDIIRKINISIVAGKNIICLCQLKDEAVEQLTQRCQQQGVSFRYLYSQQKAETEKVLMNKVRLYRMEAPVIFIGELIPNLNGTEYLLQLRQQYENAGYKTLTISSNRNSQLLNCFMIPDEIMQIGLSEEDKIYFFNAYVHQLEEKYRPDVVLIQLPGGLMKYDEMITNQFGIFAYLIGQAIDADYFMVNVPFEMLDISSLKKLRENLQHRLGCSVDAIALSNIVTWMSSSYEKGRVEVNYLSASVVKEAISDYEKANHKKIYNPFKNEDYRALFEASLHKLQGYAEVQNVIN